MSTPRPGHPVKMKALLSRSGSQATSAACSAEIAHGRARFRLELLNVILPGRHLLGDMLGVEAAEDDCLSGCLLRGLAPGVRVTDVFDAAVHACRRSERTLHEGGIGMRPHPESRKAISAYGYAPVRRC